MINILPTRRRSGSAVQSPNFGRTVKVVGTVENIDPEDLPHPKVRRGDLGKGIQTWYNNSTSEDPLLRVLSNRGALDERNQFHRVLPTLPRGSRNPTVTTADPRALSNHIKAVALAYGADLVGIGRTHPTMFYKGGRFIDDDAEEDDGMDDVEKLAQRFPFVVVTPVSFDYEMVQAHRHAIGDLGYSIADQRIALVRAGLERAISELGYNVITGAVVPQAAALAAGLGELGRNGMVITKDFGARIVLNSIVATDMPLIADKPIDIGVEDFCKVCRKCAVTCPTNSVPFGDKVVWNGVEKYKINWETCYKLRPHAHGHWSTCFTCITVCPYTKPKTWWHRLATTVLHYTPRVLRPVSVRILKLIDDRFWGTIPRRRVRILGYDSGIKPGEKTCTIAGCTVAHVGAHHEAPKGDVGYYFPLKENTNRFVKRG